MVEIEGQIQLAYMLIALGLATVEQIEEFFRKDGHDDETLAQIRAECERRIVRRG